MAKQHRMLQGCATCQMCTGNAFTRSVGRATADIATLGIAHLARKKCRACEHPMSEHQTAEVQVVQPQPAKTKSARPQPAQIVLPAPPPARQGPPSVPPGWYPDPNDARVLTWWDGAAWLPHTRHLRA